MLEAIRHVAKIDQRKPEEIETASRRTIDDATDTAKLTSVPA